MMTTEDLERLKAAFAVKPSFEFPSPEGQVGYPPELLELDEAQLKHLIEVRHRYEAEARDGEADDVPPIPEDTLPVNADDAPVDGDVDAPVALSD